MPPRVETLYKKTDAGLIGKPPSTRFYGQVQLPPSPAGPLRPTAGLRQGAPVKRLINVCRAKPSRSPVSKRNLYRLRTWFGFTGYGSNPLSWSKEGSNPSEPTNIRRKKTRHHCPCPREWKGGSNPFFGKGGSNPPCATFRGVAQVGQSCGLLIREPWVQIPPPRQSVRSVPITIGRSLACVEASLANKGRKV